MKRLTFLRLCGFVWQAGAEVVLLHEGPQGPPDPSIKPQCIRADTFHCPVWKFLQFTAALLEMSFMLD